MTLGWVWWRAWSPMAPSRRGLLRGRRGTSYHLPSLSVADMALYEIHLRFVWQAWHLMTWIVTLRCRRGTYGTGLALAARLVSPWRRDAAAFCVADMPLRDICLDFASQAWRYVRSNFALYDRRAT